MTSLDPSAQLPTKEELTVPELNISSPALKAAAHHFGKFCDNESKELMLCMSEEKDPRKCLSAGKDVTNCAYKFFNQIRANCMKEFTTYWKCVDDAGFHMELQECRKTQAVFDKCVLDKLGWERPAPGYFSRTRLHETSRPKPEEPTAEIPPWIPGPRKSLETEPVEESAKLFGRKGRNYAALF